MTASNARARLAGYLYKRYGLCKLQTEFERLVSALEGQEIEGGLAQLDPMLVAASTNGETHFLRHPDQFEWLEHRWLPTFLAGPPRIARILSAGCSTGEEAYSLVATLRPQIPITDGWGLEVDAFDINPRALQSARVGRYSQWCMRGVCMSEVSHWLRIEENGVAVSDWVKGAVRFFRHNLLDPLADGALYDLIFCRNVLIYFHEEAVLSTYKNLGRHLTDGGLLICGPSDPGAPQKAGLGLQWHGNVRAFTRAPSRRKSQSKTPRPTVLARPASLAFRLANLSTTSSLSPDERIADPQPASWSVESHCLGAMAALEANQIPAAVARARQAVYLEPEAPFVVYLLATALDRLGEKEAARRRYQWTLRLLDGVSEAQILEYSGGLPASQLKEILRARSG